MIDSHPTILPIPEMHTVLHRLDSDANKIDPRLTLVREPNSDRAAAYRLLRHRLQHERGNPRVIVVTSPKPKEGKSTCAANLALAFAEFGRGRVLLFEANLASPQLAAIFGCRPPVCITDQLELRRRQETARWDVIEVQAPSARIHLACADPDRKHAHPLDGLYFDRALAMLREAPYDFIIVDAPSVLGSADVNLLEVAADGILVTAWAHRSLGTDIRECVSQLTADKFLGVVLFDP